MGASNAFGGAWVRTSMAGKPEFWPWSMATYTVGLTGDRKSTRLNSSHRCISYAVFCLKKQEKESRQTSLAFLARFAWLVLIPLILDIGSVKAACSGSIVWSESMKKAIFFFFLKKRATPGIPPLSLTGPFPS